MLHDCLLVIIAAENHPMKVNHPSPLHTTHCYGFSVKGYGISFPWPWHHVGRGSECDCAPVLEGDPKRSPCDFGSIFGWQPLWDAPALEGIKSKGTACLLAVSHPHINYYPLLFG
jgi:hypothetical protein